MNRDCTWIRELLSEALDGELPEERQESVTAHLRGCEGCRRTFQQLEGVRAALRNLASETPSPELRDRVRQLWHPILRPRPSLRLYPYLSASPRWWDVRGLRLLGHLGGVLTTAAGFALILAFLGSFSVEQSRLTGPGVYSLLTRPTMRVEAWFDHEEFMLEEDSEAAFADPSRLVTDTQVDAQVLARFAYDEMEAFHEDSLSVITQVKPGGRSAIEGVLHSPRDRKLFLNFKRLLSSSQFALPVSATSAGGRVVRSFRRIIVTS